VENGENAASGNLYAVLMARGALNAAEAAFNFAIAIAFGQHAKSFELRASLSPARLFGSTRQT
jgi:hypothetical protein